MSSADGSGKGEAPEPTLTFFAPGQKKHLSRDQATTRPHASPAGAIEGSKSGNILIVFFLVRRRTSQVQLSSGARAQARRLAEAAAFSSLDLMERSYDFKDMPNLSRGEGGGADKAPFRPRGISNPEPDFHISNQPTPPPPFQTRHVLTSAPSTKQSPTPSHVKP